MEIGIDSFASTGNLENPLDAEGNMRSMSELLRRIEFADECGLDVFGIGEHPFIPASIKRIPASS